MDINIQEIIELEDCSEFAIRKRNEETKRALARYRHGKPKPDPEEKGILIKAMEIYKNQVNKKMPRDIMHYFIIISQAAL